MFHCCCTTQARAIAQPANKVNTWQYAHQAFTQNSSQQNEILGQTPTFRDFSWGFACFLAVFCWPDTKPEQRNNKQQKSPMLRPGFDPQPFQGASTALPLPHIDLLLPMRARTAQGAQIPVLLPFCGATDSSPELSGSMAVPQVLGFNPRWDHF